jgi:RimJ/RimL family protein N-acetyltransferase
MSSSSTTTPPPDSQQLLQFGILVITLGIVLCLIGLYPGITGVEPKSGIGILQIFIILGGLSLIIYGGFVFVKVVFYSAESDSLTQRIAMRLSMTGLLFSVAAGLSDVLGYGSNPPVGEDASPILGWFQSGGIVFGFIAASLGVLLYVMAGSEKGEAVKQGVVGLIIRHVSPDDAANFLALCLRLDDETKFMMLQPGERKLTELEQRTKIGSVLEHDNQVIIVAEHQGALVGYIQAEGGAFERNVHNAMLIIGIRQDYAGQGIGTRLLSAVEDWARQSDIHRLELTVMRHNAAAVGLYQKMGFVIEGTRADAMLIDGVYVDEYYMARLLDS